MADVGVFGLGRNSVPGDCDCRDHGAVGGGGGAVDLVAGAEE